VSDPQFEWPDETCDGTCVGGREWKGLYLETQDELRLLGEAYAGAHVVWAERQVARAEVARLQTENERLRHGDVYWAENVIMRAALIVIRGNTVIGPGLGYGCRTAVNAIRELVDAALASVKDGDA